MRFEFGDFCYDSSQLLLFRCEEPVHLTPKAMALLEILIVNRPAVVRHEQLFDSLWPDVIVHHANLKNLVGDLRRALDDHRRQGRFIRAVHGRGYAFTSKVRELPDASQKRISSAALVHGATRILLPPGESVVGRGGDATIHLDSPSVSRHHARITVDGERVIVEDLGSRNGTIVSGMRALGPVELMHGDELRFGLLAFMLSLGHGEEPVTASFGDEFPTPRELRL